MQHFNGGRRRRNILLCSFQFVIFLTGHETHGVPLFNHFEFAIDRADISAEDEEEEVKNVAIALWQIVKM